MEKAGKILLVIVSITYPVLIFLGLVVFKTPPRILSLCIAFVVVVNFLAFTGRKAAGGKKNVGKYILTGVLALLVVFIFIFNSEVCLKLYPVIINVSLLATFGWTLLRPPVMILRFASIQDKTLSEQEGYPGIVSYCRKVTIIWCSFFVFNILMSLYTTFFLSDFFWSLYNGLISYILIGVLFFGEMAVRHFVQKR
ncbi:MAG: hypothetical protein JEZ04_02550 [Spirochaetales bacterium]|nr:hypothetical protein [Spirochaetales bacterium]